MGDNTTHSRLSPSARHRWGACPGSVREEAKYPEPPAGAAALDGTRTHAILEYCVKANLIGPLHLIGNSFGYEHDGEKDVFVVDADRANRVKLAVDYIESRVKEEGVPAISERRVHPDGFLGRADCSGTVDVQIRGKKVLEIADYKDGMHPVSAKDNPQLEVYALGALAEIPADQYPKTVRMTVIQPKLALKGMPAISSHDIPVEELLAKVEVIKAQAAATEAPDAPLVPGESQCKYCKAKGACPALASHAMEKVNLMFGPVSQPTEFPPTVAANIESAGRQIAEVLEPANQAANQNPTEMTNDQLRQILEAEPLIKQLLEGTKAEVQRRLEAGVPVPGFKLVNGRGSRKWALPEDEMVKKLVGMGIPKTACYKTELISPAQAEKLVWDKKGETQKLSDKQIERLNKEYVSTVMGKPSVAPESDSRQAVLMDASSMFGAVEPSEAVKKGIIVPAMIDAEKAGKWPLADVAPPEPVTPEPAPAALPEWLSVPAWLQ